MEPKKRMRRSNRYRSRQEYCRAVMLNDFAASVQGKYSELLKTVEDPEDHGILTEAWDPLEVMKPKGRDHRYYDGMRSGFRLAFRAIQNVLEKWEPAFDLSKQIRGRVKWESQFVESDRRTLKEIPMFASRFPSGLERKGRYEYTKKQGAAHRKLLKKLKLFTEEHDEGLPYLNEAAKSLKVSAKDIRVCIEYAQCRGTSRRLTIERDDKARPYLYIP